MAGERYLTLQEAVGDALGVVLFKHPPLRNAVNTLVNALDKAGLVSLKETQGISNRKLTLPSTYQTCLVNAVLIQGVFAEPKTVIKLFRDRGVRTQHAKWARTLLIDQQSVAGQGFIPSSLLRFLDLLEADTDLNVQRLPNPFADTLPQMGIGATRSSSLLQLLAAQNAVLSHGDSMMAYYLNGNLEQAYQAALAVTSDNPTLLLYRDLVVKNYNDAKAVVDLLNAWR